MKIIAVVVLFSLMGMLGAVVYNTNDVPEQVSHLPEQDGTKDSYELPQDIIGFLSEEAIQKCLEYHIFENPYDWELNIFHLPFDGEKIKYISSNMSCWQLIDSYYIYARLGSIDFHENPILSISIVNTDTGESVVVRPEIFPDILDILKDGRDGSSVLATPEKGDDISSNSEMSK